MIKCWILDIERENSQPITSWHIILYLQNIANYKAPLIATRFCYYYSKTNWNLPSVVEIRGIMHAKTNHTSTRVSDDISSLSHVSNDRGSPIGCWQVSPWKSKHFGQSKDAMCLGENVLKLLQSNCDTCHQSSFATCRSPTPKLL